ncbi:universal stress protein [Williamsia sp. CHRR-6]|uniref:universal stress protein n=1 Tax=Williamsia sp. CHRR-6 TaxID=2835871 RepID=UPI001BDA69E7|nr:universal stress protein [Williamsia sp. CHRR-6]MBT0566811.1 universal stress protein [Williamsia sp. CHRR-6]
MSTEPIRRITVGYKATPSGEDGVALAVAIAECTGAAIDLVCIVRMEEPDGVPGRAAYQDLLVQRATSWLADGAAHVPAGIAVERHAIVAESFTEGLLDFAVSSGAGLIVVGGTRDSIFGRHALGTVSSELLHCSPLPVALAPRGYAERAAVPLTTITVAVPESARADNPLPFSLALAEQASLSLRLVSLVSLDDDEDIDAETSAQTRARHIAAANAVLAQAQRSVTTVPSIDATVADGDTLEDALETLRWGEGDVVAVGSARLAAPERIFLGSTAARILRSTTAPIVVVPKARG